MSTIFREEVWKGFGTLVLFCIVFGAARQLGPHATQIALTLLALWICFRFCAPLLVESEHKLAVFLVMLIGLVGTSLWKPGYTLPAMSIGLALLSMQQNGPMLGRVRAFMLGFSITAFTGLAFLTELGLGLALLLAMILLGIRLSLLHSTKPHKPSSMFSQRGDPKGSIKA